MCGRFTQRRDPSEIAQIFGADLADDDLTGERYNVAPTDRVTVVVERDDRRLVEAHRWGLVPSFAADPSGAARLINARAETVHSTPAFRTAFARRRCIVPADGFYEWQRRGRVSQPYLIRPPDGSGIALAGLWSVWREQGSDQWLRSCAVVTTAANRLVAELHDRMPVIVPPEAWAAWLDPTLAGSALSPLLRPAPEQSLELVPVSRRVNDPRCEGPDLVVPIELSPERSTEPEHRSLWGAPGRDPV